MGTTGYEVSGGGRGAARAPAVSLLVVWLTAALLGCSSSGGDASTKPLRRVDPAALLESAPLKQAIGSPFVADRGAAWYSDFDRLARFDVRTGRWSTVGLPGGKGRIDSLAFTPDGNGGLRAVSATCATACEEGVALTLRAWSVTPELEVRPLGLNLKLSDGSLVAAVPGSQQERFSVVNGTDTTLVTLEGNTATTESIGRPVSVLCGTDGGLVGVEDDPVGVEDDPTAGAMIAPRIVVAGPSLAALKPVAVSDRETALLGSPDAFALCGPGATLALVGPDQASEYRAGTWRAVPSDVKVPLARQLPSGTMAGVAGRTLQAGTVANLERNDQGWHLAAQGSRPSGYAVVGKQIVGYPAKR